MSWILLGLVVGVLAKWIMPGKDLGGFIITILLGIAGALLGGWLASIMSIGAVTGFNFWSIVIAVIGAIILLAIYRLLKKKPA